MKRKLHLLGLLIITGLLGAIAVGVHSAGATSPATKVHIVGTWADETTSNLSGGWVLWSNGNVEPFAGATNYGNATRYRLNDFVGIIGDVNDDGYWLITSTGRIYTYGSTCNGGSLVDTSGTPQYGVIGAIHLSNQTLEGLSLVTQRGRVYPFVCQERGGSG